MLLSLANASGGRASVVGAAAFRNAVGAGRAAGVVGRQPYTVFSRSLSNSARGWSQVPVLRTHCTLHQSWQLNAQRWLPSGTARSMAAATQAAATIPARRPPCVQRAASFSTQTTSAPAADKAAGSESSTTTGSGPVGTLEERVARLEELVAAQEKKLADVETVAKKKGGMIQTVMQYGIPFALWYGFCWVSMWFSIYVLLETGIVSWKDSLQPLFQSLGLDGHTENLDPSMGNAVIAFVINECLEAFRFPLVLATGIPVIKAVRRFRGVPAAPP